MTRAARCCRVPVRTIVHDQAVLVGCLRRLRVVRPTGLFELLAAVEVLRFELGHRPAVVAVDGVGSFFWQDKVADGRAQRRQILTALSVAGGRQPAEVFGVLLLLPRPRAACYSLLGGVLRRGLVAREAAAVGKVYGGGVDGSPGAKTTINNERIFFFQIGLHHGVAHQRPATCLPTIGSPLLQPV